MHSAELLAAGYSLIFLLAAMALRRRRPRAWQTAGLAACGLGLALSAPFATTLGGETLRAWWLLGFLPLAYWMPAPLAGRADERLEAWLLSVDRRLGLGPIMRAPLLELSYLLVYAMVPAGLGAVLLGGGVSADEYWRSVLLAVMPCYGLLPVATTRPPRALMATSEILESPQSTRRLNVGFLAIFGNQWNTLPSGHAAGSVAVAMLVWHSGSPSAPAFALVAAGISAGTVTGRYHYVVDTALGVAIGLLAGAIV